MKPDTDSPTGARLLATDLRFRYPGADVDSLNGLSISVEGGVVGLVGPNGAGKTTFLRIVAGLLRPGAGKVLIDNVPPAAFVRDGGCGFLPEDPRLPAYRTVGEFLSGVSLATANPQPGQESTWLDAAAPLLEKRCSSLSLGQRKRVALIAARIGSPRLLLLDEPTNGLDPTAVQLLRSDLMAERDRGVTLVVSSHHLDELRRLADRVLFVCGGALIGDIDRVRDHAAFDDLDSYYNNLMATVPHDA